jgi:hypothetical protein
MDREDTRGTVVAQQSCAGEVWLRTGPRFHIMKERSSTVVRAHGRGLSVPTYR